MKILSLRCFVQKFHYSTVNNYSKTVLLPKTKFPLRLNGQKLIERDTFVNEINAGLYSWQRKHLSGPDFVLHDGPPYANGVPHMGHAINKILKDTIIRTKILQGKRVHYVPGWDCHGLPIELKAIKNNKESLTPMEIRKRARNFATQTIEKQKAAFQSWGVLGDWENPYKTFNINYIKNQLIQFYNLYEKNLIYRDVKPVYWSPSSRTALAEAELEYNMEHKSRAVTLRLKTAQVPDFLSKYKNLYILIWTTTPWTLPSNQAVCYKDNLSYSIIKDEGREEHYVIATNLVPELSKSLNKDLIILETFSGEKLNNIKYIHPFYKTDLPLLSSEHATDTKGTGLVHTAPAHGPDDFKVALKNNIKIICMVDEHGKYTDEAGSILKGLSVLSTGTDKVLDMLKDDIIHLEDFIHSYPYDWRTKQPVILRASKQWFIDTNAIKDRAAELIKDLEIIPNVNREMYKQNLMGQLKKRPFWCISRQRIWGVPIPMFYEKSTGNHVTNREIILHLCNLLEKHGPDFWWKLSIEELLTNDILKTLNCNIDDLEKGQDILDIWFDSGISWSSVLPDEQIADIYLEGLDQFTGWFQSSLTTSVAIRDKVPYKCVYVHGFALDEKGHKMSKSLGNVIVPHDIMYGKGAQKGFGVDTLRWWVACHANQDVTAQISKNVLEASAEEVQKIRSVLRFALGGLFDYEDVEMEYQSLKIVDKYLLHHLYLFKEQVDIYFQEYQFHKICQLTINLLTNQVSALYYMSIKDRLYCEPNSDISRKAAQYILFQIFKVLSKSIAPIVPHLTEELYSHIPQKKFASIYQEEVLEVPDFWKNADVEEAMQILLNVKRDFNKSCGSNVMEQVVEISFSRDLFNIEKDNLAEELCDLLQVSDVHIKFDTNQKELYKLEINKTDKYRCERCRRYAAVTESELCSRCNFVVHNIENKNVIQN